MTGVRTWLLAAPLAGGCAHRVPEPAPQPLAPVEVSAAERVCWIEFATTTLPRRIGVAHGAVAEDLTITASGLLVQSHGQTWLIDGGMAVDVPAQIDGVGGWTGWFLKKASKGWERSVTPEAGLDAVGVRADALTGALPTHGHWDHLGGLVDLSGPPIWVASEEQEDARRASAGDKSGVTPRDARGLLPRARILPWDGGPIWLWPASHDPTGHGDLAVVPMPGHSPGSVGVVVRLPDQRLVLLVGDTVWVRESFEQLEPKSWLASHLVDADRRATSDQVGRLWSLHEQAPEVRIVPAHDRRSWVDVFGRPGCLEGPPGPPEAPSPEPEDR